MSNRPQCPGSFKAVPIPNTASRDAKRTAVCEQCGARLELKLNCFPRHRFRQCLAPGCEANAKVGGLCAEHGKEIVGVA